VARFFSRATPWTGLMITPRGTRIHRDESNKFSSNHEKWLDHGVETELRYLFAETVDGCTKM
jgi:hypothetical protein